MSTSDITAGFAGIERKLTGFIDQTGEEVRELATRLAAIEQRSGAADIPRPGRKSIGDAVFDALDRDRDMLNKAGRLQFTIEQKAAGDPVLTSAVGSIATLPNVASPGGGYGIQAALLPGTMESVSQLKYTRYSAVEGAAAVQTEGSGKAAITPTFTSITQDALTCAGYVKVSEQALNDRSELRAAIESVLMRQLNILVDDVLIDGAGGAFAGYESLASASTSLTYTNLPDALSEGVSEMQQAGFRPTICVMSPADWLAIVVAKASGGSEEYLSGSYLQPLPESLRGMRVAISSQVAAGKGLLIDPAFVQWYLSQAMTFVADRAGDDFTKNLITIRGECRLIPTFRAAGSARLVTPKA